MTTFYTKRTQDRYITYPSSTVSTTEEVQPKVENKKTQNKKMEDKRLERVEAIVGSKAPERKVKIEKKDKGLIERTENSTILLTEDNKMVLND